MNCGMALHFSYSKSTRFHEFTTASSHALTSCQYPLLGVKIWPVTKAGINDGSCAKVASVLHMDDIFGKENGVSRR